MRTYRGFFYRVVPCFSLGPCLPSEHLTWFGDMAFRFLFWVWRALCSLAPYQCRLTWALSLLPGSYRKLSAQGQSMGQHWPSVLLDGGQGRWQNSGEPGRGTLSKGQSCSLDGQAAVVEEVTDDRWVSHCRCVPQVMVILSNLPKHSPHNFT